MPRDSDRCASRTWQSCTGVSFRPVTARRPPGQPVQGPLASLTPLIGVATRPATEPGPLRVRSHPQVSRCRPACEGRLPGGGGTVASSACGLTCADGCNGGGSKWEFVGKHRWGEKRREAAKDALFKFAAARPSNAMDALYPIFREFQTKNKILFGISGFTDIYGWK